MLLFKTLKKKISSGLLDTSLVKRKKSEQSLVESRVSKITRGTESCNVKRGWRSLACLASQNGVH